jgi:hypothetical protein
MRAGTGFLDVLMRAWRPMAVGLLACGLATGAAADDDAAGLAQKLANPIADLISVPFQANYDDDIGPADGWRTQINVQPVIPFSISKDWGVISRTILPLVDQDDIAGASGHQSGLGDTTQSLFLSPAQSADGLTWGVGPVFLLPTATDELLGTGKWGVGPTGVALVQSGGWTYGMLANQIWSVAGQSGRKDVSSSFLQPFLVYTTSGATSFALNTESTYDWNAETWSVPINLMVSQLFKVGSQPISVQGGLRYWADSPDAGPEEGGLGFRFNVTFLFPK